MKINTKTIVTLATLTAIGYALSWLEFPIFSATPFLKLDFSATTTLLAGYLFGFWGATASELIKQLLCFLTKSSTGGIGELANFLVIVGFVTVPSLLYRAKKGRKWVIIGMGIGTSIMVTFALLTNRFIMFPLYVGDGAVQLFGATWGFILAFNAIKAVSVCVVTFVLYKRLSTALRWERGKTLAKTGQAVYNIGMKEIITNGEKETEKFAFEMAKTFSGGEVVLLTGDLGAGKTVFAKGVAKALGVQGEVKSPTFTLCCEYQGEKLRLIHIDAYRLKSGEEAEACGLNERFGDSATITLIEWPSQIQSVLPKKAISITIERLSDNQRRIIINGQ